ncbi:outer membrane protein assembly factor BamB family protein [Nonomuraea sp. SYSU D8015]|uniref:outer membrane protein assembly factor BamB family protein n=1 Tax=Nonomuraea sp. SYSU D8015 TaxID=2593644 RepID=UPI00166088CF|nr:PQQ-binding-like beta-propeller repeat protein [Nonomuraea sp. SYSU D8015]
MLRTIAPVAALVLLLTGCTSPPSAPKPPDAPEIRTDHTTSTARPARLTASGPAPGVLREDWGIDLGDFQGEQTAVVTLHDGQLFVHAPDGFTVRNPATGAELWHYREPGRELISLGATGDTVVIRTAIRTDSRSDDLTATRVTALDTGTGRRLWATAKDLHVGDHSGRMLIGAGVLPVQHQNENGPNSIEGIDVRTGTSRWVAPYKPDKEDCSLDLVEKTGHGRSADGSVFVAWEFCFPSATGKLFGLTHERPPRSPRCRCPRARTTARLPGWTPLRTGCSCCTALAGVGGPSATRSADQVIAWR